MYRCRCTYELFQVLQLSIRLRQQRLLKLSFPQCENGSILPPFREILFRKLMFPVKHTLDLQAKIIDSC